jgi:hypothetical protein
VLSPKRLDAAAELHKERYKKNNQIELVDCLQFCDKSDLTLRSGEFRSRLGLGSKKTGERLLSRAEGLRNSLAHSQTDLAEGSSWPEIIEAIESIEAAVHASDEAVEREAKSSHKTVDFLWVAG